MEALEIKTGVILFFIRVNVVAAIHYLSHQKMLLPTSVPFVGGKMMYSFKVMMRQVMKTVVFRLIKLVVITRNVDYLAQISIHRNGQNKNERQKARTDTLMKIK